MVQCSQVVTVLTVLVGVLGWALYFSSVYTPSSFELRAPPDLPPRRIWQAAQAFLDLIDLFKSMVLPAQFELVEMTKGYISLQLIHTCIQLGIPDAIPLNLTSEYSDWPTITEIAANCSAAKDLKRSLHSEHLYRFVRALTAIGIFKELPHRRFTHTARSLALRKDHPYKTQGLSYTWATNHYIGFQGLLPKLLAESEGQSEESLKSGFEYLTGTDLWTYYNNNPKELTHFQAMFDEISSAMLPPLGWDFDWNKELTTTKPLLVCDVGGGSGTVLELVLRDAHNSKLQGILLDLPEVIERTANLPRWKNFPPNPVKFVGGSFLNEKDMPEAHVYLLRMIVHDWSDKLVITILKNIHKKMIRSDKSKIYIMEQVLESEGSLSKTRPMPVELADMMMMTMLNGKERTKQQFEELLTAAGFVDVRIHYTRGIFHVIEASAK